MLFDGNSLGRSLGELEMDGNVLGSTLFGDIELDGLPLGSNDGCTLLLLLLLLLGNRLGV
jgi:hypothetical protein